MKIQWLTTAPNPRSFSGGFDAGRVGWKRHAVQAEDSETFAAIVGRTAACGLVARHGWDDDLFIPVTDNMADYRCLKCRRKLGIQDGSGYAVRLREALARGEK